MRERVCQRLKRCSAAAPQSNPSKIEGCSKLNSLCGGLEHLTAMDQLDLCNLPNLNLGNAREGQEDVGIPWHCLH